MTLGLSDRLLQQCSMAVAYVSLAEVLIARPYGITEKETWALLCQAVQALQDLFLSDGMTNSRSVPILSPSTLLLCSKGRVRLSLNKITTTTTYAAPEYQIHASTSSSYTENDIEKMLVYSLGECMKQASLLTRSVSMPLNQELCQLLITMGRQPASERATLMHLLDVISKYSKNRSELSKPFSHTVMDLYQETIIYRYSNPDLQNSTFPPHINEQHIILPCIDRNDLAFSRIENIDACKSISSKWKSYSNIHNLDYSECAKNIYTFEGLRKIPDQQREPQRLKSVCTKDDKNILRKCYSQKKKNTKRNPVQRAASRLYHVIDDNAKCYPCTGPEFVLRTELPCKHIILHDVTLRESKACTVIMLNGVKLYIQCKPESTTAGKLFEEIIRNENIEENYFLGLSVLISGDFVFLPSDVKLSKILTSKVASNEILTLYIRVRFFLPSLRGIRSQQTRHLLYLQLRRSMLENHLPCSIDQMIELGGLALQAEFGNYLKKHQTNHYFLLEHYLPETMIWSSSSSEKLRQILTQAHGQCGGLSVEKSEERFIILAQSLPYYGVHFYSGTLISKILNRDVWLCVSAHGINLLVRNHSEIPDDKSLIYDTFKWQAIQTLCYSKHYLCILPHNTVARKTFPRKYKLKMEHKKSYYTFRLVSLHHQFFLRLRSEYSSILSVTQQFGVLLKDIKNESNSISKVASHNQKQNEQHWKSYCNLKDSMAIKNQFGNRSSSCKRSQSVNELTYNMQLEEFQNLQNANPKEITEYMDHMSSIPYVANVWDRRKGVKMGTRVFTSTGQRICRSLETINDCNLDESEKKSLNSSSRSSSSSYAITPNTDVYILDSSIKSLDDPFLPDLCETLSDSLAAKLKNMSFADERILKLITIHRDENGSLGIQVTEGSDGKPYIQSVLPHGPANATGQMYKGDQIIAVNKQNLLNMKYSEALEILKKTNDTVELILSQSSHPQYLQTTNYNLTRTHNLLKPSCEFEDLMSYNLNYTVKNYTNSKCKDILQIPTAEEYGIEISPLKNVSSKSCDIGTSKFSYPIDECSQKNVVVCQSMKEVSHVALPRSLGLGRRWRGPVRYPVTPIKNEKQQQNPYLHTSDDEQILF